MFSCVVKEGKSDQLHLAVPA